MVACYVIFSEKLNRFYIGATQSDFNERLEKHNLHQYGNHRFTSKADDWKLFLVIETSTFSQALAIEKHIKKMKSSSYIKNLLKYPDMVEKLKNIYIK